MAPPFLLTVPGSCTPSSIIPAVLLYSPVILLPAPPVCQDLISTPYGLKSLDSPLTLVFIRVTGQGQLSVCLSYPGLGAGLGHSEYRVVASTTQDTGHSSSSPAAILALHFISELFRYLTVGL